MKKADWDVGIAVDAIKLAEKVDAIILCSGDGDFYPLLEYVKGVKGCLAEVMSFRETTSSHLLEIVDGYTDLSANPSRYLMKAGEIRRPGGGGEHEAPARTGTERTEIERTEPAPRRTLGRVLRGRGRARKTEESEEQQSTSNIYPIMTPWS